MKYLYCFGFSLAMCTNSYSQIKWHLIDDTTTLTPNIFTAPGSVTIPNKSSAIQVSGTLEIILNAKTVILNTSNDIFSLKDKQIQSITLDKFGYFEQPNLFKDDFTDSLLHYYRRTLYPILDLNEISFSSSKRVQYSLEDTGLIIKNQKILYGKLCYADIDNITLLDENGEIHNLKDGDFNFFQYLGTKIFSCKGLYDYLFKNYQQKLQEIINSWNERVKDESLEELIKSFGAIDKIINLPSDKKMISWKQNLQAYNLHLSTTNLVTNNYRYTVTNTLFTNISPFFLYQYTINTSALRIVTQGSSSTFQSGDIISKDIGYSLTIIQDSSNKTIDVFQKNIFSEPTYGMPFKFINF
jgi:hypothetical protein